MQTKLQELTEKIYQEGVNKAKDESEKILAEARKEAEKIVEQAKKNAEELVKNAEKESEELKKNSLNELQLSGRQLMSDIKQKVVNLIEAKSITPEAKGAFKDLEFTRDVVLNLIKNWKPESNENVNISVLLPKEKQAELEKFFKEKASDLLNKGLELEFSDKIKGGMKIGPKDGGYMISFSDDDFDNLFKSYMRPKLIELLYSK